MDRISARYVKQHGDKIQVLYGGSGYLYRSSFKTFSGGRGWTAGKPRSFNHQGFAKPPAPATPL
jgi:hypothetical protein